MHSLSIISRWDGSQWWPLGSGIGGLGCYGTSVSNLLVSGTDLYIAGYFSEAGGKGVRNIVRWDGTDWWPLGSGIPGFPSYGYAMASHGGSLYVAGYFGEAGGVPASNIAKWDGIRWSPLGSGT